MTVPMIRPDVSVVVVTYRSASVIQACLDAVGAAGQALATRDGAQGLEVIVLDSASDDDTHAAVLRSDTATRFVPLGSNRGFAAGVNRGLDLARGRHVLLLNPDTVLSAESLARLVHHLDAHPSAAAAAPRILDAQGTEQPSAQAFPSLALELARQYARWVRPLGLVDDGHRDRSTAGPVPWVSGACLLLRAEAIARVGRFDDTFFLYYEETDWCRRAAADGWEVHLVPEATCMHIGGASAATAGEKMRHGCLEHHFQNSRRRYYRKHHGRATAHAVDALHALRGALGRIQSGRRPIEEISV